ncbi:hypothetical protein A1QO_00615 [Vibrio genomosp. F10 str. ZF-129]|uniref:Conjugal transfer protein n=1 Tax=Vibrio genomosp. F10 str. ZF-129 TaxID=1187848 RepID=A0A1E5BG96_9VIBR|nr:hypothetical protein [Vibrio genomosp. F10]OEE35294.1 hypothetical protein A1QO_00615 [Vibrio genomosp. F10 str. ZF-129]
MKTKFILPSLISFLVLGCSSGSHIPKSGISTEDVYHGGTSATYTGNSKASGNRNSVPWRSTTPHERAEVDVYTLHNSPRVNFQLLDNPTIYFYVPPKLSKTDRVPIPGYFSEFKLLEKDEYALPSERNLSNSETYNFKQGE